MITRKSERVTETREHTRSARLASALTLARGGLPGHALP